MEAGQLHAAGSKLVQKVVGSASDSVSDGADTLHELNFRAADLTDVQVAARLHCHQFTVQEHGKAARPRCIVAQSSRCGHMPQPVRQKLTVVWA